MNSEARGQLLELAWQSIRHAVEQASPLPLRSEDCPATLREDGACFVTLRRGGELRGCIGSLQAHRPLCQDVVHNAYAAALEDPRFMPLRAEELDGLELHISLLGPSEPLEVANEAALLKALRPGVDGLILEDGPHRATFLPSVWEQLPEPVQFLQQLKRKAGLPADHWSATMRFARYQCESVE